MAGRPGRPALTARNQVVVDLYTTEGWSAIQIAKKFKISRQRVYQILDLNGVTERARDTRYAERYAKIMASIREGKSYSEIVDEYKDEFPISKSTVSRIARKANGK